MKKVIIIILVVSTPIIVFIFLGGGFGTKEQVTDKYSGSVLFGHRGGVNNLFVENSKEAILRGIELGFNGIEIDIRLTKDKKVVVFHDESCLKLLGIDKDIKELNWSDIESKKLLLSQKETSSSPLLLDELIKIIPDSILIYVDVKVSSFELADYLLDFLKEREIDDQMIIADEDIIFLSYLKYNNIKSKLVLEGFNKGKEWTYSLIPKNFKPEYYASHISKVDSNHVIFLRKNKLLQNKIAYGVNSRNIDDAIQFGIPNLIYDYDSLGYEIEIIKKILNSGL